MCACEPGYTCTGCRDTPHDPRYHDELDPRDDNPGRGDGLTWSDRDDPSRR